jgi:hypothetical protein
VIEITVIASPSKAKGAAIQGLKGGAPRFVDRHAAFRLAMTTCASSDA